MGKVQAVGRLQLHSRCAPAHWCAYQLSGQGLDISHGLPLCYLHYGIADMPARAWMHRVTHGPCAQQPCACICWAGAGSSFYQLASLAAVRL